MLSFLDEVQALKAIKELFCTATTAKIAVAFWGSGAIANLGLNRSGLVVEAICNLDSGACNPIEIDNLRQLSPRVRIKSDPRLHAKVYWTPDGVVIGSSNASTNGLAVEIGLSGWAEANILSNDRKLIEATNEWFETRRQNAYQITDDQIGRATQLWNDRARSAPAGLKLEGDLGAAVRGSPDHLAWFSVKLAFYGEGLSREARKALKEEQSANPILRGMDVYESWHNEIKAGDWLLDFEVDGAQGSFGGYWSVPSPKLESDLLTYVCERPAVSVSGFGSMKLSRTDLSKLERVALTLVRRFGDDTSQFAMVPIREALEFVDTRSKSPSSERKAFARAMLDIFKEASKIGYHPNEFLRMIEQDDPLLVAKRLIMRPRPSSGFTRLWGLKRLDLTVEALALRDQWQHLFSREELNRAKSRLKQYQ